MVISKQVPLFVLRIPILWLYCPHMRTWQVDTSGIVVCMSMARYLLGTRDPFRPLSL